MSFQHKSDTSLPCINALFTHSSIHLFIHSFVLQHLPRACYVPWAHCLPTTLSVKHTLQVWPSRPSPPLRLPLSLTQHTSTSFRLLSSPGCLQPQALYLLSLSRSRCPLPGDSFSVLSSRLTGPLPTDTHLTNLPTTTFTSFLALATQRSDLWTCLCSLVYCQSFLGPCPRCMSSPWSKAGCRADIQ